VSSDDSEGAKCCFFKGEIKASYGTGHDQLLYIIKRIQNIMKLCKYLYALDVQYLLSFKLHSSKNLFIFRLRIVTVQFVKV